MNDLTKNILLWVVIVMVMVVVFSRYVPTGTEPAPVSYSQVLEDVRNGRVESVILRGDELVGVRKDKSKFKAYNPETENTALIGFLDKSHVDVRGEAPKQPNFLMQLLLQLAPALLLILVFVYMLRQIAGLGWRPRCHVLRQEPRKVVRRRPGQCHVRRRRRRR